MAKPQIIIALLILYFANIKIGLAADKESESAGICLGMVMKAEEFGVDVSDLWRPGAKYAASVYPRFQRLMPRIEQCMKGSRETKIFESCLEQLPNASDKAFMKMVNAGSHQAILSYRRNGKKSFIAETEYACSMAPKKFH